MVWCRLYGWYGVGTYGGFRKGEGAHTFGGSSHAIIATRPGSLPVWPQHRTVASHWWCSVVVVVVVVVVV